MMFNNPKGSVEEAVVGTPRQPWYRQRKKLLLAVAVLLAIAIALIVLIFVLNKEDKDAPSDNPIVASYQKQLPGLSKKVNDEPDNAQARQDYAVALYATGDVKGAKEQYEKLVELSPKDASARNNLGNVFRDLGEYENAVKSYQEAIKLDSKQVNAYTNLANLYIYTLDKADLGIKTYQDALKNMPDNQEIRVLLGIAYEQNGDKASAKQAFEEALQADANNSAAKAGLTRVQ